MSAPGQRRALPRAALVVAITVLASALVASSAWWSHGVTTTTTAPTTTTTIARERPQRGWAVASTSGRGVLVDVTTVAVGGASFRVVRLRARTTLLRWHVGLGDPRAWMRVPSDAGPSIDWPVEGPPGVVAVFNGGFKQSAGAGGAMADGLVLEPPIAGRMTIALDAAGHWAMGVWGAAFPPKGFHPISYRQNLVPLVRGGAPTAAASGPVGAWGSVLGPRPEVPRTGLGVDAKGNLLYVATMDDVLPLQLARALVRAGALEAMQLDINPYWPIAGATRAPVHGSHAHYPIQLPGSHHDADVYNTGWIRDFFVAMAEPSTWTCDWTGAGLGEGAVPRPQGLSLTGDCSGVTPVRPPTTTTTSTAAQRG